ncbi:MAG: type II toxin-antitoxin system VapC family toxin [Roseiarcus sp.]|jgi:ribonuclease VapC
MVETSALAAIVLGEPERQAFLERIAAADRPLMLATGVLETVLALSRQKRISPEDAYEIVADLIAELRIEIVDFVAAMLPLAVAARQKYGAGKDRLNMGDCLSYAAARHHGAELLFKGADFQRTDVNADVGGRE